MPESNPKPIPFLSPEDISRFKSLFRQGNPDKCWEWQGNRTRAGYGVMNTKLRKGPLKAHRIAFFVSNGDPGYLNVLHHCDNRPCVNPLHLFLGTTADNVADKMKKGRHRGGRGPKGSIHGRSKLMESQIPEIIYLHKQGVSTAEIARTYSVSGPSIARIIDGTGWTHVKSHGAANTHH